MTMKSKFGFVPNTQTSSPTKIHDSKWLIRPCLTSIFKYNLHIVLAIIRKYQLLTDVMLDFEFGNFITQGRLRITLIFLMCP